jgi:putative endonuclease
MTNRRQALGRLGEDTAAHYLQERGYTILERNLRTPHGEIDILAIREDVLTFVEVKMRSSNAYGFPEDAVSPRKQAHMLMAAEHYFEHHPEGSETWQFDIIAITRRSGLPPEIEHFENIIG